MYSAWSVLHGLRLTGLSSITDLACNLACGHDNDFGRPISRYRLNVIGPIYNTLSS